MSRTLEEPLKALDAYAGNQAGYAVAIPQRLVDHARHLKRTGSHASADIICPAATREI
jgi:hypothetical protein